MFSHTVFLIHTVAIHSQSASFTVLHADITLNIFLLNRHNGIPYLGFYFLIREEKYWFVNISSYVISLVSLFIFYSNICLLNRQICIQCYLCVALET